MKTLKRIPHSQAELREMFDYRDENLYWKVRGMGRQMDKPAGCIDNSTGYRRIRIGGRLYRAHRLVWLWHNGFDAEHILDHIDKDKANNNINNLREATQVCNLRNTEIRSDNRSGVKGVSWHKASSKWRAQIMVRGKPIHLGSYHEMFDACQARAAGEIEYGFDSCQHDSTAMQFCADALLEERCL